MPRPQKMTTAGIKLTDNTHSQAEKNWKAWNIFKRTYTHSR